jgi:nitroreductase
MAQSEPSDQNRPDRPGGLRPSLAELPKQLVTAVLEAAAAAPSMHNTQPWRFRVRHELQTIELRADPGRVLASGDPRGRAVHIACGAALFNIRLAATAAGRQPAASLLPDPRQPLLLATVRLAAPYRASPQEHDLHAAIVRRRTNRRPFSRRPVPPGVLAELTEAARLEGAILHILDHDEAVRVLKLAQEAERSLLAEAGYRAELAQWSGGTRDADGIPDSALGSRSPDGPSPVRDFALGRPAPLGFEWFEDTPQLAVLSTHFGERVDWLRAGQALQRVLLTATDRGIAACPLTQPLETADAWQVRDPRSGCEQPQMILRIGYGLPVPPAPRRPLADMLDD